MGRSSLDHKIEQKYFDPTYSGSTMRRMTPNATLSSNTIVHTAIANTTVGSVVASGGQSGETFTYTLNDPAGLFKITTNVVSNIAANPPIGSYPITVTVIGSKGSMSTRPFTIIST